MNNVYELMMNHRSMRKYKEEEIPMENLNKIISTAIHGPALLTDSNLASWG